MRLGKDAKNLVFALIRKYCKENNIDKQKLKACEIEAMPDRCFLVLSKDHGYGSETLLEHDIETQPDIVLIFEFTEDEEAVKITKTEHTYRIENSSE